ncbi:MAG: ferredoxin family protein [Firmicutes bacterium]|nr:ferredoxin family protein [Bacillota bacterium]
MNVQIKTATLLFREDQNSHIKLDYAACEACQTKPCLNICPAQMFSLTAQGDILFSYEGCLECGACSIICSYLTWYYPRGGYGVVFREV